MCRAPLNLHWLVFPKFNIPIFLYAKIDIYLYNYTTSCFRWEYIGATSAKSPNTSWKCHLKEINHWLQTMSRKTRILFYDVQLCESEVELLFRDINPYNPTHIPNINIYLGSLQFGFLDIFYTWLLAMCAEFYDWTQLHPFVGTF